MEPKIIQIFMKRIFLILSVAFLSLSLNAQTNVYRVCGDSEKTYSLVGAKELSNNIGQNTEIILFNEENKKERHKKPRIRKKLISKKFIKKTPKKLTKKNQKSRSKK